MWIERVDVEGFRRLEGPYDFSHTLTVVFGDNEAGKSSLHDALVRTLFGFSKTERRRSRGSSPLERRAPWDGRPYRLVGHIRNDSRSFRVEWEFGTHTVRVVDELGTDLSDQILGKGDEIALGEFLVGMGLDDFKQVCCIDQDALLSVRSSPSLGVALQEAVANIAGDTPVEEAIENLDDFLRSVVGARVDNLNPSPKGRLSALAQDRNRLREALEAANEARNELSRVSRERAKAREKHDGLLSERESIRRSLFLSELRALEERFAKAEELERRAADRPPADESPDKDAVEAVKLARQQIEDIDRNLASAKTEAAAVAEPVAALEEQQRELRAAVDGLALYEDIDTSARERAQTAWAQLVALDREHAGDPDPVAERDAMLARYREERDELHEIAIGRRRVTWRRVLWIALVILTLGLAWLIRKIVRRLRGVRPEALEERLAEYGARTLDELDARVADEDRRVMQVEAVVEAYATKRQQDEERRRTITHELEEALDAVASPPAALAERARAYLLAVERHAELAEKRAELERLRRRLLEQRRPAEELARLQDERGKVESRLRDAFVKLDIDAENLDAADGAFNRLVAAAEVGDKRVREADEAKAALSSVLDDDSIETLVRRVSEARSRFDAHHSEHGELPLQTGEAAVLSERLEEVETSLRGAVESLAGLEMRAEQLEQEAGDPAALKEALAEIDAKLVRLDEAKRAVALARETLRQSAAELRREFAPHLNEALRRNLGRITGGRYSQAMVDADLAVKVVVPETGRVESAEELSRATKDQLFLVQRLEIARLLAPTNSNPPLFLDDPFAHYDAKRLRYGLEVVAEAAAERQIVLFTENPDVLALAREFCETCGVIELEAPVAA